MKVSPKVLKWVLRFYPPLFFQRIWIQRFDKNFRSVEVKIFKSLLNTNFNNSIFGGTIYAASDPFYAILFDQVLQLKGFKTRVWLKSAHIQYLKPGRENLYFKIVITDQEIAEAIHVLETNGKFVKAFPLEIYNKRGELCALVSNEVYIRNLYKGEENVVAY
jgi:hypothetical protein